MSLKNPFVSLVLGAALTGCVATPGRVSLRTDTRFQGGDESVASITSPEEWTLGAKKSDRLELRAPDNFSTLTMSVAPVLAPADRCPELAYQLARGAVQNTSALRPLGDGNAVDFEEQIPGTPPGPTDRSVFGRAFCGKGAAVLAVCSIAVERKESFGGDCRRALTTLQVETAARPLIPSSQPQPAQPPANP
jgi:hypothetical protein